MRSRGTRILVASLATLLALGLTASRAGAQEKQPQTYLKTKAGFSDGDLKKLDVGQVIVKDLKTTENQEVAAIGSVRIKASEDASIDAFRNIVAWKQGAGIKMVGKFGNPAQASDFQALTFDPKDLQDLQQCTPGDCKLKFSTAEIKRFNALNWSAADATQQANARQRTILAEEAKDYLTGGMTALPPYNDKETPQDRAAQFKALLGNSPYVMQYAPDLDAYLGSYPGATLADHEDIFLWTQEKFGLKPVTRLTHLIIRNSAAGGGAGYTIASKHIYNNHYFQAGLELSSARSDGQGGFYLTTIARYRVDPVTGMMAGTIRGQIRGGVRENIQNNLTRVQQRLQTGNGAAQ